MRRRLLLFLIIFGVSITVLAMVLQGDPLFRNVEKPSIRVSAKDTIDSLVTMGGKEGSVVQIAGLPTELEYPVGRWETALNEEGVEQRYNTGTLTLPNAEAYSDEFISTDPFLILRGDGPDHVRARVDAGQATLFVHGEIDLDDFGQDELPDVRTVHLSNGVTMRVFGDDEAPGFTLVTEQLDLDLPPGFDPDTQALPPVHLPRPIVLTREDDSVRLEGAGGVFDQASRRIVLQPPVFVRLNSVLWSDSVDEKTSSFLGNEPLTLRGEGPLTYSWSSPETAPTSPRTTGQLQLAIGDGRLEFEHGVLLEQGPRWMEAETVVLEIDRRRVEDAETKEPGKRFRYGLSSLEAFDRLNETPIEFALLGGTGTARRVRYNHQARVFRMVGDVLLKDLQYEGEDATLRIDALGARDRVVVTWPDLDAAADDEASGVDTTADSSPPQPLQIVMLNHAFVQIDGELEARADEVVALAAPVARNEEPATPDDVAPADGDHPNKVKKETSQRRFDFRELHLKGSAAFSITGDRGLQGTGSADAIDVVPETEHTRRVTFTGPTVLDLTGDDKGAFQSVYLEGDDVTLIVPNDDAPKEAKRGFEADVRRLVTAHFTPSDASSLELLPTAGSQPSTEDTADETDAATETENASPEPPSEIRIQPLVPTRLLARSDSVDVAGRSIYRIGTKEEFAQPNQVDELTTLTCDAFRWWASEESDAEPIRPPEATGDVDIRALKEGFAMTADRVTFDDVLVAEGVPAHAEFAWEASTLNLDAETLRFDRDGGLLVAESTRRGGSVLVLPVSLMDAIKARRDENDPADPQADRALGEISDDDGRFDWDQLTLSATKLTWKADFEALRASTDDDSQTPTSEPDAAGEEKPAPEVDPDEPLWAKEIPPFGTLDAEDAVVLQAGDSTRFEGDHFRLDEKGVARLSGAPARFVHRDPSEDGKPAPPERTVESDWFDVSVRDDGTFRFDLAPHAVWTSYVPARRVRDLQDGEVKEDAWRKVVLRTGDDTWFEDRVLRSTGGIELFVHLNDDVAHATAERIELFLDDTLERGGRPVRAHAQRSVSVTHPWFRCQSELLSFDFETQWMVLKDGLEPCRMDGNSAALPPGFEAMQVTFRQLRVRLVEGDASGRIPVDDLVIDHPRIVPRRDHVADAGSDSR